MFEDYSIQILAVTAPQMVHALSTILPYSFQHFGHQLKRACLYRY